MLAFTPFVQVATYATRHFATFGLAPAAAPILLMLVISTPIRAIPQIIGICMRLKVTPLSARWNRGGFTSSRAGALCLPGRLTRRSEPPHPLAGHVVSKGLGAGLATIALAGVGAGIVIEVLILCGILAGIGCHHK